MKWELKKKAKNLKMKKSLFLIFGIILILSFLNLISAVTQPTQQFSKLFLTPFYTQSTTQNINNTFSITINSPDGIGSVNSAIINFDIWLNPSVTFRLWVNNRPCNNPIYYVSTTYASAGKNMISFDCSNVINNVGNYQVILKADKDTGAVTGWLDLAYMTNPKGDMTIHGTEYTYGQIGKTWLQLLDNNGTAITNGVCYVDIYTPDGDYFIERATMTNMQHDGIYYYDLDIPILSGVFPVIATCYYIAGETDNFPTSITMINGTLNAGTTADVQVLDTNYLTTTESPAGSGNPRRTNTQWNFSSSKICNISESLLTGITLSWVGKWNSNLANDVLTFQIYNYTSSQWINLLNTVIGSGTGVKSVTNSISLNNVTKAGLVNASGGNSLIRVVDTSLVDTTSSGFDTDYFSLKCIQLASPQWQQVKGSSELHITSDFDYIAENLVYSINNTQVTQLYDGTNILENYYTGIFNHRFEISSGVSVTKNNVLIEYQELHSIPCSSIISFYFINATGYYQYPFKTQRQTEEDHCSINFYINLTKGQNYEFEVHARNSWESNIRSTNTGIGAIYPLLDGGCKLWQVLKGYPAYIIPKNQTNEIYDYYYRACANFYDDYYWFNQTYHQSLIDKNLISDDVSFLQYEADYTSMKFAEDKLNSVTFLLLNNLQAVASYSKLILDNPLGNLTNMSDQKIWASFSTQYQNWQLLNASCGTGVCNVNATQIWAFSNRTLTAFTFDLTPNVNTTELSFQIWNFASRNLTFTLDSTNYTLINQLINNRTDIVNYTHINQLINNRTDIINYTLINELLYNMNITDVTNYTLINQLINNRNDIVNYTKIYELIENQTRIDMTNYTHIGFSVWNWAGAISNSIISAFTNAIIQPVASAVWNFAGGRNLTYTEDVSNYSKVAEYVWLYENKSLTFYQVNNISVEDIWGYMNRSLSFYPDAPEFNYSLMSEYNWNYVGRNLTFENINNLSVAEIWSYYNRSLSDNLPLQIWNYPDKNLSGTNLPFEIWNYQNRSLTYYTINLTELIEMINAYDFTQTPIPYNDMGIIDINHELNVSLMVQK